MPYADLTSLNWSAYIIKGFVEERLLHSFDPDFRESQVTVLFFLYFFEHPGKEQWW